MSYRNSFICYCIFAVISGSAFSAPGASEKTENNLVAPDWSMQSKIYSENPVNNLDVDQLTLLTLMSNLMNVSEGELDLNIKTLYADLKEDGSINISGEMAKYAILLKSFIPLICSVNEGISPVNKDGKEVSAIELSMAHLSSLASNNEVNGLSILGDQNNYIQNNSVMLRTEIIPILVPSKLVCDSLGSKSLLVSNVDLILNRAGYASGRLVILDPSNPNIDELGDAVGNPFGQSGEELQKAASKADAEYEKNGFIEVSDHKIVDLEKMYESFKDNYKPIEQVLEKLSFLPSPKIDQHGFQFLGASERGSYTDSGYAGVSSIYDSPLGKVAISETDLVTSGTTVFLSPKSLNADINGNPASMTVYKGEGSDQYYSDVLWVDENASRMFTVEVGFNLNDESQQKNRELLLNVLNDSLGAK